MSDNNGLDITEDEFCRMAINDQNLILFKNIIFIRRKFDNYAFTKKVQYVWLTLLTSLMMAFMGIKGWLGI